MQNSTIHGGFSFAMSDCLTETPFRQQTLRPDKFAQGKFMLRASMVDVFHFPTVFMHGIFTYLHFVDVLW